MVAQSQAFSPRGEGIKVKFLVEGKAVLFCSGAYHLEFFKWAELLKGFLSCFMLYLTTLYVAVSVSVATGLGS